MAINVSFQYLYRDGSNYKSWGEVIFINPDNLTIEEISTRVEIACVNGLFSAKQIGVPEVFLYADGSVTVNDHCYHEFDCLTVTDAIATDLQNRSIRMFVEQVEFEASRGWWVFDPSERFDPILCLVQGDRKL